MTIKEYLIKNKPRVSFYLIIILFISNILTLFSDRFYDIILLFPQDIKNILTWYKLTTYPLYVGGLLRWLDSAVVIMIAGYIIEQRLSKTKFILLTIFATIIGGLIFSFVNIDDPNNRPIASPTMITWGLSACAFALAIRKLRAAHILEKIFVISFVLSLISIDFTDLGFVIGQIAVITFGLSYGLILHEENKTVSNGGRGIEP